MIARLLSTLLMAIHPAGPSHAVPPVLAKEAFVVMRTPADARAQLNPVMTYDGRGMYLLVWQQGRFYHQSQSADILAVRIDAHGRVLDRKPIVICNAAASQEQPQVTFSAGRFLVVWHDLRNGRDWDVYAARMKPDGTVLEPNGFLVAGGAQNQANPVLAPAENGFLVVWQHYDRYYRLKASMIPVGGHAQPGYPLNFHGEALWGGEHALVRVGDGWLLSWNDERSWSKSSGATGMITRHFARLAVHDGKATVLKVQRAPAIHVGRSGGLFSSDGKSTALYAGSSIVGRGNRAATAILLDGVRAAAIKNPNPEQAKQGSGWNTEYMMTLFNIGVPVDSPVATAFGQGVYLAVARKAYSGKPSDRNLLLGSRLTTAGIRLDAASSWPVLHDSPHRIANPVLAGGEGHFMLAFEQEDADGRRHIWAKSLRVK